MRPLREKNNEHNQVRRPLMQCIDAALGCRIAIAEPRHSQNAVEILAAIGCIGDSQNDYGEKQQTKSMMGALCYHRNTPVSAGGQALP